MQHRIMIVEDDAAIARLLEENLRAWGYEALSCRDLADVLGEFSREKPHLLLLDVGLPFFNGYHWCEQIRRISTAPIVFISSRTGSMDAVMAMTMGGDDFISKPFDMALIVAKIGALLRRTYDFTGASETLEHRGAVLNPADSTLTLGERVISLTRNETRILQTLMEHKGVIVSRDTLMQRLWDSDLFIDDNTLTVNVGRLRRKLEEAGLPDFIVTKKGQGYLVERL